MRSISPFALSRRTGIEVRLVSPSVKSSVRTAALLTSFLLTGCGVAQIAVEASREAAKDIRVTTSRHYDQAKFVDTQTVAVFVKGVGENGAFNLSGFGYGATGGSTAEVIQSRISAVLVRRGLDILEAGDLERFTTDQEMDKPTERMIVGLAKKAGAEMAVIGIAETGSQFKFGLFGVGAGSESGIVSASVKFVDAESGRPMAFLSADYKEPKSANEVIDQIAPFIDRIMKGEAKNIQERNDSLY